MDLMSEPSAIHHVYEVYKVCDVRTVRMMPAQEHRLITRTMNRHEWNIGVIDRSEIAICCRQRP